MKETRLWEEAQANALLKQDQAMKMQQPLFQQQQFMAAQQAALQEAFAQFRANMQGSTLSDLPPLPPLPTFNFVSLPTFQSCILPSYLKIMHYHLSRDKAPITVW